MTAEATPQHRIPGLDGLRAVAVGVVMVSHWLVPGLLPGGFVGVDVFFTISGFLITSLLIDEWDRRDRIRLGYFYARRALRLLPALAAVMVASVVVVSIEGGMAAERHETIAGLPWVTLFAANWARVTSSDPNVLGFLPHMWSLAVEEQFYLVWPVAFTFLAARRIRRLRIAQVLGGVAVTELAWRLVLIAGHASTVRVANGIDTRTDGLLLGCALAFVLADGRLRLGSRSHDQRRHGAGLLGAAVIAAACVSNPASSPTHLAVVYAVVPLATAAVIWDLACGPQPTLSRILTCAPMRWVGRRSYGLYLWHLPILISLAGVVHSPLLRGVIGTSLAVPLAGLSWRFLEAPVNRYRTRFSRSEVEASALVS